MALVGVTVPLAFTARNGPRWLAALLAVMLTAVVLFLTHVTKRYRVLEPVSGRPRRQRALLRQLGAGVILMAMWWVGTRPAWSDSLRTYTEFAGIGFIGLVVLFLCLAWFVAEFREGTPAVGRRGRELLIASTLLGGVVVFLFPLSAGKWGLLLIVLAFMFGQLGIVAASHRILRLGVGAPTRARQVVWLAIGVLLLSATSVLFVYQAGWWWTMWLIIPIVGLMILTTSRGEWDSIIIVLLFVMIWATSPTETPAPSELRPAASDSVFVVFGDSYISGEGARVYYDGTNREGDNECRRSPESWTPILRAESTAVPDKMIFLGCSGAKARELWFVDQKAQGSHAERWEGRGQIAEYRQRYPEPENVEFAIVSIGGNDSGFAEIGSTCVGPGDCTEIASAWLDDLHEARPFDDIPDRETATGTPAPDPDTTGLRTLEQELVTVYEKISEAIGDKPVIAVPYPSPADPTGCDYSLLSRNEHRLIDAFVTQLNGVVERAARTAGAYYLREVADAVEGSRICEKRPGRSDINFLWPTPVSGTLEESLSPANWVHGSLHPNRRGHRHMADAAIRWFADDPLSRPPVYPSGEPPGKKTIEEILPDGPQTCGADAPGPDACGFADQPGRWSFAQFLLLGRLIYLPLVATFAGAWLVSLTWVAHQEAHDSLTAERAKDALMSSSGGKLQHGGFAPSEFERALYWLAAELPKPWVAERIDPRRS